MNIIIVGAGEIGRHLAIELSRQEHTVSVIESDAVQASELQGEIEGKVVIGDGSSVNTLAEANIGDCELFLALTSENSVNLMCASMVKSMGVERVISRVHPGLQREEWLFDFRGHFGIDHIFSSERLAAIELAKFIRNPDSLVVEEIARGRIELQQVRVSSKTVSALATSWELSRLTNATLVFAGNLSDFNGSPTTSLSELTRTCCNSIRPRAISSTTSESGFRINFANSIAANLSELKI